MKLTHEQHDHIAVLGMTGDLTLDEIEPLKRMANERMAANTCDFVLDISGVEFIDSAGLETLLWLQDQAGERLGQVRLVNPSPNVKTILHITRLASTLPSLSSVPDALKSLR
jgi:anti-anti-sigma factor